MKARLVLLLILISTQSLIYSYSMFGGQSDIEFMRSELAFSFWNAENIDSDLDGYLIGTGFFNSFGDKLLFVGTDLIIFQHIGISDKENSQGLSLGIEVGTFIPISEKHNILLAGGYNFISLSDENFTANSPSVRIGYNSNNLIFSVGYNFTFGIFTTIGFQQIF